MRGRKNGKVLAQASKVLVIGEINSRGTTYSTANGLLTLNCLLEFAESIPKVFSFIHNKYYLHSHRFINLIVLNILQCTYVHCILHLNYVHFVFINYTSKIGDTNRIKTKKGKKTICRWELSSEHLYSMLGPEFNTIINQEVMHTYNPSTVKAEKGSQSYDVTHVNAELTKYIYTYIWCRLNLTHD